MRPPFKVKMKTFFPLYTFVLFLSVGGVIGGCGESLKSDETDPASIKLEGQPDKLLVGKWKSDSSGAIYQFNEDGTYSLRSNVKAREGGFEIKVDAEWRRKGDKILLQDASKIVVPYTVSLEGNQLTLTSTGISRTKTVLSRQ